MIDIIFNNSANTSDGFKAASGGDSTLTNATNIYSANTSDGFKVGHEN